MVNAAVDQAWRQDGAVRAVDPPPIAMVVVWMGGVVLSACLCSAFGAPARSAAVFAALTLAPCLGLLALAPRWGEIGARLVVICIWIACVGAGAAVSGGAVSPAMAGFAVPLALGAGRESNATRLEIGVFVILSAAMAAILGALAPVAPVHPTLGFAAAGLSLVLATLLVWAAPLHVPPAPASGVSTQTLAMVAHELRTPLNHIIGFADVMDQRLLGPLPDVYADYPGLISNAGRHQLDLVNLLVDFGRLEAGRYPYTPEPIAPGAIVEEIVRGAAGGAGDRNIALDLDLSRAPSVAYLDPRSWRQMLYNLIGNAVKFTLAGGRVTIGLAQIDSMLRLEVSDTGPGLSDAEKQRIGALYERSEAATGIEGAGLGLAVTMALAALHGGRLSLHDNLASGLMVRVDLPNAP